jgi:hypothetical protein
MLVPKKASKTRQMLLIVIVVIIFGAIIYILYTNFFAGSLPTSGESPDTAALTQSVLALAVSDLEFKLDNDFLTKPPYINLKPVLTGPIIVDQIGRTNPFDQIIFRPGYTATTTPAEQ